MSIRIATALALAACVSLSGCGESEKSTSTPKADTKTAATSSEESKKPTSIGLGEEAEYGDWTIEVESVDRTSDATGGAPAPAAGREYVVATIKLTNGAAEGQGIGPVSFMLDAGDGALAAVQTSDPAFIFNTKQPIAADETRTVKIAWDVPSGTTGLKLTFAPFVEGETPDEVTITLD